MLIEKQESVLVVIDVQDYFLDKIPHDQRQPLLDRITWLIHVARYSNIPVVVTAEDIPHLKGSCLQVRDSLPEDVADTNKMVFGLGGDTNTLAAVEKTKKKTAVLVGLETDVCVCHSALGLLQSGYRVAVIEDATCSPGTAHNQGMERLRNSDVIITSTKGIFYEWMRTVDDVNQILSSFEGKISLPDSLIL